MFGETRNFSSMVELSGARGLNAYKEIEVLR